MQDSPTQKKSEQTATREKLLDAAIKTFARDGLYRATTRVIAAEAGVNEVTLFRHFQNKEGLINAVMSRVVEFHANEGLADDALWKGELKPNLLRFAKTLYASMERDEAFIRTMVGEAKRHPDHSQKVIMDAVKPTRARFVANLEAARKAGHIRKGVDLIVAADAFTGMLFGGMLKNTTGCVDEYTATQYVATCVDIFAAGLAPAARP